MKSLPLLRRAAFLLVFTVNTPFVSAQVREEWTARYRTPDALSDVPQALALTPGGPLVATLSQFKDGTSLATVLQYAQDGHLRWTVPYRSGTNGYIYQDIRLVADRDGGAYLAAFASTNRAVDGSQILSVLHIEAGGGMTEFARLGPALAVRPSALILDRLGNVLVHGTLGTSTGLVYLTLKFDPAGQLRWARDYAGPARQDQAGKMVVDGEGNVYVTGRSPAANQINDIATLKYSPDGTRLWVQRFGAEDPLASDSGRDLVLDGSNSVTVAGGGDLGFVTLRYSLAGERLWMANRTNEIGSGPAEFIAADRTGNLYLAGGTASLAHGADWRLVKQDAEGHTLWQREYFRTAAYDDNIGGLAMDAGGSVYLTGSCVTNAFGAAVLSTARYSTDGDEVWRVEHPTPVRPFGVGHGIVLEANGDLYVMATARDAERRDDVMLVRYVQAAAAPPTLSCRLADDGSLEITAVAQPGLFYSIEGSSDLVSWEFVSSLFNDSGVFTLRAPIDPRSSFRAYRAVRRP